MIRITIETVHSELALRDVVRFLTGLQLAAVAAALADDEGGGYMRLLVGRTLKRQRAIDAEEYLRTLGQMAFDGDNAFRMRPAAVRPAAGSARAALVRIPTPVVLESVSAGSLETVLQDTLGAIERFFGKLFRHDSVLLGADAGAATRVVRELAREARVSDQILVAGIATEGVREIGGACAKMGAQSASINQRRAATS